MAKFVTVNCGTTRVLCNIDCSVQHVLVYLETKCDEPKIEIFTKDEENERNEQSLTQSGKMTHVQSHVRGRRAKQINLDDCFTQYDLLDGDGGLLELSLCPPRARVADILIRKIFLYPAVYKLM